MVGLTAGGHLAGGGQLPQPADLADLADLAALCALCALCALSIIPVAALTRFRLSFPALAGMLGAGQLWLHWAFGALSMGAPPAVPPALLSRPRRHATTTLAHQMSL